MASSPGEAVKILRSELGVSQSWLAEQIGVSQQTIARWEGGGEVPTRHLPDLAMTLGTTVADLVGGGEPQSYLLRLTGKKSERFAEEPDPGERFGTLRLRWLPSVRELLNPEPVSEHQWPKPFEREYAISNGERQRLSLRLDDRDEPSSSWFSFYSLNNRLVFVNRSQLESLELVGEPIESLPPYEHEEIYRALDDRRLRNALMSDQPLEAFPGEDAPFSAATIQRCLDLAASLGSLDKLFDQIDYASAETIDGREIELTPAPDDWTLGELQVLEIELDGIWKAGRSVDDWLIELESEGWERSCLYRLGSLRVIEVPLLKYNEARERQWAE